MFGGGLVWLYKHLAGMQVDPRRPGYKHIIFKPQPVDQLDFVSYSNNTPYGKAGIAWKKQGDRLIMDIEVPVSSVATVYVPSEGISNVKEGGQDIREIPFIHELRQEDNYTVLEVESGKYSFEVD
jgi:alpha-L-rhamnosidase